MNIYFLMKTYLKGSQQMAGKFKDVHQQEILKESEQVSG